MIRGEGYTQHGNPFASVVGDGRPFCIGFLAGLAMQRSFEGLFQWHANMLMAQRYEDLARQFTSPTEISCGKLRASLGDHDELTQYFRRYHVGLLRRGVQDMKARVVALALPSDSQYRVWVRWSENGSDGKAISHAQAAYFCQDTKAGPLIRRVHFTETEMPEIAGRFGPRRLAAMR